MTRSAVARQGSPVPVELPSRGTRSVPPSFVLLPPVPTLAQLAGTGTRAVIESGAPLGASHRTSVHLVSVGQRLFLRDPNGTESALARDVAIDARVVVQVQGRRCDAIALRVQPAEERDAITAAYIARFGYRPATRALLQAGAAEATYELFARPVRRRT